MRNPGTLRNPYFADVGVDIWCVKFEVKKKQPKIYESNNKHLTHTCKNKQLHASDISRLIDFSLIFILFPAHAEESRLKKQAKSVPRQVSTTVLLNTRKVALMDQKKLVEDPVPLHLLLAPENKFHQFTQNSDQH